MNINKFLGADLTSEKSYVSPFRSPDCPNMIRESSGKVRKWIGWYNAKKYPDRINGFHTFKGENGEKQLVHSGNKLYLNDTVIYDNLADKRSVSRQLNSKLIIADGKTLLMYDGNICVPVSDNAYIPKVVISRKASGGGTSYEPINLIGTQRKDSFICEKDDVTFQLSANNLLSVDKAEKLSTDGTYYEIYNFTSDLTSGKVTFSEPIGESAVTGHDNLIITYSKATDGYAEKINNAEIMTLYGVGGAMDRLFIAGDKKHPNRDYYCQLNDPTYWGDLFYNVIGEDGSKIMGYSLINDKLATHMDKSENHTNIILRSGDVLKDGSASFKICGSFQGSGRVSRYAFSTLETEPLFMTNDGIMAVTPSDVLGERYSQLRSYYINGLLLKQNLAEAVACTFDRFYMVNTGGYLFAIDGTQSRREENQPYSSRQYECYYRTNVHARCIANINGELTFGTDDGYVRKFHSDYSRLKNFNDEGEPISAKWTTPEIVGRNFYYKKRFKLISAMIGSAAATGVKISAIYDGICEVQVNYDNSARYFSFSKLTFSKLSFKTDTSAYIFKEKVSIKPDSRKLQIAFENDILNEPLALYDASVEFTESR